MTAAVRLDLPVSLWPMQCERAIKPCTDASDRRECARRPQRCRWPVRRAKISDTTLFRVVRPVRPLSQSSKAARFITTPRRRWLVRPVDFRVCAVLPPQRPPEHPHRDTPARTRPRSHAACSGGGWSISPARICATVPGSIPPAAAIAAIRAGRSGASSAGSAPLENFNQCEPSVFGLCNALRRCASEPSMPGDGPLRRSPRQPCRAQNSYVDVPSDHPHRVVALNSDAQSPSGPPRPEPSC